jgi:hypothetical protein
VGCSDCGLQGGCDARKHDQRTLFAEILPRIYPDLTWGRPDDQARFGAGVRPSEASRLGRALSELLRAPTFFRPGGESDLCHFVYVLCFGREPALLDVRDGHARLDGSEVERVTERYLRVAFSTVARLAAVQEVEFELSAEDGLWSVRETPRAGVYDGTLLKRLRQLTAFLQASDVTYCDFGLLDKPIARVLAGWEARAGDYIDRWGEEPRLANFLFFEQPTSTASLTFLSPSTLAPSTS